MFGLCALHHPYALFSVKIFVHSQTPVPFIHYSLYCSYHWLCQSQCCLQWSYEGDIEVDACWLFRLQWCGWKRDKRVHRRGKLRVFFWAVNLLNPTLAMSIICWMLSTRCWVISQLPIKQWWHLLSCWPLSLRCTTDCHYWHTLSSSTRSIELSRQNIFQVAAVCIYLWINVWLLLVCQACRNVNMF